MINGKRDSYVYETDLSYLIDQFFLNYVVDRFNKKERLLLNRDGNCMKIKLYVSEDIYNKLNNSYNNLYN